MTEKKKNLPTDDKAPKKPRRAKQTPPAPAETSASTDYLQPERTLAKSASFPIVGIGASAGGLEALETFFAHMPPDSGMAFVVIQHLDPSHKSMLLDLIKRHTQMRLFTVEDGLAVEPNCIYIIPPNRDLTIRQGRLFLNRPAAAHGLRLPIDIFFRSLAAAQTERAIGIVLSGAGSDGTLGLKAIKEVGGLVMAQEPASARYDGMPQSAIATGLADYILPPDQMPQQLLSYINLAPFTDRPRPAALLLDGMDALQKIFILLRTRTGHDFSLYKKNTVNRRIERRMAVRQITDTEEYVQYLQHDSAEVQTLFKELLIGVTGFFRDAPAFQVLETEVMPQLFENRRSDQPVRLWIPGCATGEEAYCMAILLQEQMIALKREFKVQLFATDIDEDALERARQGIYPESIATDVSPERLQHFFGRVNGAYQVNEQIRKMVVFATQSVIKDPPFSKLDLISCRNLLIYLEPELQKKAVSLFYYALKPGGHLFLGTSETPVELAPLFTPISRKWKIFQRPQTGPERRGMLDFVTPSWVGPEVNVPELTKQLDTRAVIEKLILESHVQPCMVINEQSEILFIYGQVGRYLEPQVGEVGSWNILRLVREELRMPLGAAIRLAMAQRQPVTNENVPLKLNKEAFMVTLTVRPIVKPPSLQGLMMVLFEASLPSGEAKTAESAASLSAGQDQRLAELEQELESTKEYLQATIEELESSNEEIKSTNEELQSANEELETSQEEAQSINEELVTLNTELQNKVDELIWVNSDVNNILTSIDVGIIFLDRHLHIRRFNQAATQVANLIETDVGRPIEHIVSNLAYPDWLQDARLVFETLVPKEVEVQIKTGQWYLMRIRPYRTTENAIEGVVMTFTNISEQKQAIATVDIERALARSIVDTVQHALLVLDARLRVISANTVFHETFKVEPAETRGRLIYELGNRQWDIPRLRQLLEEVIPQNSVFENFEVEHTFPTIGRKKMRLNARQIKPLDEQPALILLVIEDITGTW